MMIDTEAIGAIVREERKATGLLQTELAAVSGVGVRFLIELEAGKPTAQIGKVIDVLNALGCSLVVRRPVGILAEQPKIGDRPDV